MHTPQPRITDPYDAGTTILMKLVNDDSPGITVWEGISITDEQDTRQLIRRNAA